MKFILRYFLATLSLVTAAAGAPKVVLIHGEQYDGSEKSMPALAKQLRDQFGYDTEVLTSPDGSRALPNLDSLADADLLILYIRLREATDDQVSALNAYLESGKPAIALRTTSHGLSELPGWFVPHFGGHFKTHTGQKEANQAFVPLEAKSHPILAGVLPTFSA
ncbi:MAG: hypothetical protein ACKVHP_12085, partial [Verrucomicrobiales bacterium]